MSAFALILNFDGAPVDPARFARMSRWLKRRALEGSSTFAAAGFAAMRAHFEPGLECAASGLDGDQSLFFDGWLAEPLQGSSDHDSVRAALSLKNGARALPGLIGSFALAFIDPARQQILLARDALGVRTLFYRFTGSGVEVASEPMALVVADPAPPALNECFIAHQLALRAGVPNQTGFAGIHELPPGHFLTLSRDGQSDPVRYWAPPTGLMHGRSLDDYAEGYRSHLAQAVHSSSRGIGRFALTLSGGMDSGSVLLMLKAQGLAQRLATTITYVFSELSGADERAYALATRAQCASKARLIVADTLWPLRADRDFPLSANVPIFNPYGLIKRAVNQSALDAGAAVILTGTFGDHLYPPAYSWLEDAIAQGDWAYAAKALFADVRNERYRFWMSAALRRAGRRWLLADRIKAYAPPWLTAQALAHIDPYSLLLAGHRGHRRLATGLVAAQDCSGETFFSEHDGVQWRNPFRDQRLVDYCLQIPAHFSYRDGIKKAYARQALRGEMPEFTRLRVRKTSLIEIYRRGVLHQESAQIKALFDAPDALWRGYLSPQFVAAGAMGARVSESDEAVLWLTVCVELWWRRALQEHRAAQQAAPQ